MKKLRALLLLAALAAPAALLLHAPAARADDAAAAAPVAFTQGMADAIAAQKVGLDTIWVMIAAFLVFFMNLGFALVESGFCRAKNTVNILFKNFVVFAISSLAFLVIGYGLMFGDGNPFFGTSGLLFASGADNSPALGDAYQGVYHALNWTGVPLWAKFFFQLVFAGTAATIVSGAVAERIKFKAFIVFTLFLVGVVYPVGGHMIWGGGWLASKGFLDFAGSTVVHSIGGWAALAGILVLGPRLGKYGPGKQINVIPGHNMTSAAIGVFVLWFGWFGFNPGSTMAADGASIAHIATTTNVAAAAGTVSSMLAAWIFLKKPDFGITLNGCLAGLVAITAGCAFVSVLSSLVIGLVAGVLVVAAVVFFDRIRVDDPVGATAVHLANGVFGTIALGLFADPTVAPCAAVAKPGLFLGGGMAQLGPQLLGVGVVAVSVFTLSLAAWYVTKLLSGGIRVTAEEELEGLDVGEHGNSAYPEFQIRSGGAFGGTASHDGAPVAVAAVGKTTPAY
ncbi:ammonium transporter [Anaeromyxobacter dehalogenans 2CP-1]|uniref:Ammonium transporter n=1 Tax=Anaeromyxobacter dehalogenans (strain ATCC BAA-258 / DSM 21875 / 2CP-1) TaxID=455488 RepID=B8J5X4_ANAD2|nr:ammonium transporter [Anaeromyxobacter dehalogenans]ACL65071.1 ammonium transporter [Anaeromyxobacter dehalogenans 2CP-1]